MPKFMERWWERSLSRTACSPSVAILAALIVLALVVFKYHETIIRTVVITMLCVVGVLMLSGLSMIVWAFVKWNREKSRGFTIQAATVKGGSAPADPGIVDVPADVADAHPAEENAAIKRARKILADK